MDAVCHLRDHNSAEFICPFIFPKTFGTLQQRETEKVKTQDIANLPTQLLHFCVAISAFGGFIDNDLLAIQNGVSVRESGGHSRREAVRENQKDNQRSIVQKHKVRATCMCCARIETETMAVGVVRAEPKDVLQGSMTIEPAVSFQTRAPVLKNEAWMIEDTFSQLALFLKCAII